MTPKPDPNFGYFCTENPETRGKTQLLPDYITNLEIFSSYTYTSNNDSIAFENWNTGNGQPNQENDQANCVLVQNHKAQWGDIHCDAKRKYVCEFPDRFSPFYDSVQLDTSMTDVIDMIFEMFFETKFNTQMDNTLRSPSRRRYLSIGK